MITRLGEVEEGSAPKRKTDKVKGLYTAKVTLFGSRYGQIVEVVEKRSGGKVVCVFEGQRFEFSEFGLERVRRRTSRKRKKSK